MGIPAWGPLPQHAPCKTRTQARMSAVTVAPLVLQTPASNMARLLSMQTWAAHVDVKGRLAQATTQTRLDVHRQLCPVSCSTPVNIVQTKRSAPTSQVLWALWPPLSRVRQRCPGPEVIRSDASGRVQPPCTHTNPPVDVKATANHSIFPYRTRPLDICPRAPKPLVHASERRLAPAQVQRLDSSTTVSALASR